MPVHKTSGGGYQYGKSGKIYYGAYARQKAHRQAAAIKASQRRAGKRVT